VRSNIQDPALGGNIVDHDLTRSGTGDNLLLIGREPDTPDLIEVDVSPSAQVDPRRPVSTHAKLAHVTSSTAGSLTRFGKVEHRMLVFVFGGAQEVHVRRDG